MSRAGLRSTMFSATIASSIQSERSDRNANVRRLKPSRKTARIDHRMKFTTPHDRD